MSDNQDSEWVRSGKLLRDIAIDVVIAIVILMAVNIIHKGIEMTHASEEFKMSFTCIHEKVLLGMYMLLSMRTALRIGKSILLDWKIGT